MPLNNCYPCFIILEAYPTKLVFKYWSFWAPDKVVRSWMIFVKSFLNALNLLRRTASNCLLVHCICALENPLWVRDLFELLAVYVEWHLFCYVDDDNDVPMFAMNRVRFGSVGKYAEFLPAVRSVVAVMPTFVCCATFWALVITLGVFQTHVRICISAV